MAMNIAKLQAMLEHVPDNALIGYVQNPDGQVPSYLALAELSRRKEVRASNGGPVQGAPSKTVAQQEVETVQPGVAALPIPDNMYQDQSYAAGGIVSFDDGGHVSFNQEVQKFNGTDGSYVDAPGLSEADLAYAEAMHNNWVTPAVGTALDYTAFLPYTLAKKGINYLKGRQPVWDPAQGKYVLQRELPDTSKADADAKFKAEGEAGRKVREDYFKANPAAQPVADRVNAEQSRIDKTKAFLDKQARENLADPQYLANVHKQEILRDVAAGKYDQIPSMNNVSPRSPRDTLPATPATSTGLPTITAPKIQYDEAGYDQAMLPKRDAAAEAARFKAMLGEDKGIAALQDRLAKMEAKATAEGEQAPWMALAKAGFGMAAGKSPFALQNIAEGAGVGLKEYADAKARLAAGEEKRFEIQAKIAQTQRAEDMAAAKFGTESEQYADTQNRLAKLHALDAKNTAKVHDAANELTAQKNAIDAQQAAWNHQYQMGSLQNQAAQAGKLSDFETHIAGLKQDPSYYKTIETPQGPKRIFDMAKATAEYRGTDTKQAALLAPLYDKLEKTFDKGQQAAILAQIRRIEAGLYGGDPNAISPIQGIAAPRASLFKEIK